MTIILDMVIGWWCDQNLFTIDETAGRLEFINAPDLDSVADLSSSGNHSYAVILRAVDAASNASEHSLIVNISDTVLPYPLEFEFDTSTSSNHLAYV